MYDWNPLGALIYSHKYANLKYANTGGNMTLVSKYVQLSKDTLYLVLELLYGTSGIF
jgi:hypothetical protein